MQTLLTFWSKTKESSRILILYLKKLILSLGPQAISNRTLSLITLLFAQVEIWSLPMVEDARSSWPFPPIRLSCERPLLARVFILLMSVSLSQKILYGTHPLKQLSYVVKVLLPIFHFIKGFECMSFLSVTVLSGYIFSVFIEFILIQGIYIL